MRVTTKGQVTIPKYLRQRSGIRAGSEVDFDDRGDEIVLRKAPPGRTRKSRAGEDFAAYLDRVTGVVDLGMSTDDFMELMRGE